MKITEIEIRNFLSIRRVSLQLDNMGLVLLEGENRDNPGLDNNGSGKSSLIEGVVYALFGRTVRGLKADAVVHASAKKDCLVSLKLTDDDGNEYVIERNRKSKEFKNQSFLLLNGNDITPKSEAEFNAAVEGIIGMDYSTFCASTLYSATSFPVTSATDSQLKSLFEKMLNLEIWSDAHDEVKDSMRKCNESIIRSESEQRSRQERMEILRARRQEQFRLARQRAEEIEKAEAEAKQEQADAESEVREATRRVSRNRIAAQTAVDHSNNALKALRDMGESKMDAALEEKSEAMREVSEAEAAVVKADAAIDAEIVNQGRIENRVEAQRGRLNDAIRKEAEVDGKVGSKCPMCGRPLTREHLKAAKDEAHRAVVAEQNALQAEQDALNASYQRVDELSADSEKADKAVKECRKRLEAADENVKRVKREEAKRERLGDELVMLRNQQAQADANLRVAEERLTSAKRRLELATTAISRIDRSNAYETGVSDTDAEITELESEIGKADNELTNLRSYESSLRFLDVAFGNGGIKSLLLDGVTPFLNERANFYLSKLAGDRIEVLFQTQTRLASGELRDKFSVTVTNKDGGKSYAGNSGGEKKRVDLAVYLAFQDLIASRSSKKMNICLIDEAFDALDDSGMEGVVSLLSEISKERSTVLVVTHSASLRQYFSNSLTIIKENGYSTLKTKG